MATSKIPQRLQQAGPVDLVAEMPATDAAMVAVERVQSGAHHPSAIAAGAAIGLASAWLTRHTPHLMLRHLL
ncbi:phosphatase PAP2 family protein [Streptomyces sp. NPDC006285]|uniref:phosphatase PAP2 family protein n=1 Tax=Streptomyces sp. NPDC006285 TaxID=3364742 RepID=UPI0036BDB5A4